jgi:gas vesicle protein
MKTKDFSHLIKQIPSLKSNNSMSDGSKIILALVAGVAAGAALGILFAPDKGTDTRDRLSESLNNLADSIKDTAASELDKLSGLKHKVVDNIKTRISGEEAEYQDDLEHA